MEDSISLHQKDLWFPQLLSFRISLNKLTRHMPISTYVRQERVHLTEDLNQALAGETLAAFRYLYLSKIATGINSPHLSSIFQEIAKEEWAHASTLMGRIIQLGGVPLAKPTEWEKRSFLPYYEPPRRGNDLKALIKDSLKLERASIDFFQKLALKTRDNDLITYRMAMDVMAEEARDEQRVSALVE